MITTPLESVNKPQGGLFFVKSWSSGRGHRIIHTGEKRWRFLWFVNQVVPPDQLGRERSVQTHPILVCAANSLSSSEDTHSQLHPSGVLLYAKTIPSGRLLNFLLAFLCACVNCVLILLYYFIFIPLSFLKVTCLRTVYFHWTLQRSNQQTCFFSGNQGLKSRGWDCRADRDFVFFFNSFTVTKSRPWSCQVVHMQSWSFVVALIVYLIKIF